MKTRGLQTAWIILLYAVTIILAAKPSGKCKKSSCKSQEEPLKPTNFETEENQDILSTQEIKYLADPNTQDNVENQDIASTFVDKRVHGSNSNLRNERNVDKYKNYDVEKGYNIVTDNPISNGYHDVNYNVNYSPIDNSYEFNVPIEVEKLDDGQSQFSYRPFDEDLKYIVDTSNKSYHFNSPYIGDVLKPINDIKLNFDDTHINNCQGSTLIGNDFDLVTNNVYNNEKSTCTCNYEEGRINNNKHSDPLVQNIEDGNKQYDTSSKQHIFEIPLEDVKSADTTLNAISAVSCDCHDLHEHNSNEAITHTLDHIEKHDNVDDKSNYFITSGGKIEMDNEPINIKTFPPILDPLTTTLGTADDVIDKSGNDYTYAEHVCNGNVINNSVDMDMNENNHESPERKIIKNCDSGHSNTYKNYKTLRKSFYDPVTNSYEFIIPQKIEGILPSSELCSCYNDNMDSGETERYTPLQENYIDDSIIDDQNSLKAPIDNAGYHCRCFSTSPENFEHLSEINVPYADEYTPEYFINVQNHAEHFELENEVSPSVSIIWSESFANGIDLDENTCACKIKNQNLNNKSTIFEDTKVHGSGTPFTETLLDDYDNTKAAYYEISGIPSEAKDLISDYKSDIESVLPQNICACETTKNDGTLSTNTNFNHLNPENSVYDQIEIENALNDLETSKTSEKCSSPIFTPILCDIEDNISTPLNYEQVQNDVASLLEPTTETDSNIDQYKNTQKIPISYIQENNFMTPTHYEITSPSTSEAKEKPKIRTNYLNGNVFDDGLNNCQQNPKFIVTNSLDPTFSSMNIENAVNPAPSATTYYNVVNNDDFKLRHAKFQKRPKLSNAINYSTNVPPYSQKPRTKCTAALLTNRNVINDDFSNICNLNSQHYSFCVKSNLIEPPYYVKDTLDTKNNKNSYLAHGVNNLNLLTVPDTCSFKNLYTVDSKGNTSIYPSSDDARGYNSYKIRKTPTLNQYVNFILTENRGFSKHFPKNSELKPNYAMPHYDIVSSLPSASTLPAVSASYSTPCKYSNDDFLENLSSISPITAKALDVSNPLKLLSKNKPFSSIYSMNEIPVPVSKTKPPSLYSVKPNENIPLLNVPISYQTPPLSPNQVSPNKLSSLKTDFPKTTLSSESVPLVCPHKKSVNINSIPSSNYRSAFIPSRTSEQSIISNIPNAAVRFSTKPDQDLLQNLEPVFKALPALTPKPLDLNSPNPSQATTQFTPSHNYWPKSFEASQIPTNKFNSQSVPISVPTLQYSDLTPLINKEQLSFRKESTLPPISFGYNIPQKLSSMGPGFVSLIDVYPNSMSKKNPFSSISDTFIQKPIYLNTNVCPESAVSFPSNPNNGDISLTEVKPSRTGAISLVTSNLPNDMDTNVCRANAIFFSPNPCKCEMVSTESPLLRDSSEASPEATKFEPYFKPNIATISNADIIAEQPMQYSPTNIKFALSSSPIYGVTKIPKSNNLFNGKLYDSISIPKFETSLPQYLSSNQPSLSSKYIKSGAAKKTLTTPNVYTNFPPSNSFTKPLIKTIPTVPSIVTPSSISLTSASNIDDDLPVLGSATLNTAAPIVYNPFTKPTDVSTSRGLVTTLLPSVSFTAPTISNTSLFNPSPLSPPLLSPSLLNPNNTYSYMKPIVASTPGNTYTIKLPTLLNSLPSPTDSPITFYPCPAPALVRPCSYDSFYPQISVSTLDSTIIPIKSPATLPLSNNPCIPPISVLSSAKPCTKPAQSQVLTLAPISTNTNLKTLPFRAPLYTKLLQSGVNPCSMPVPDSVYSSNNSPYIVPSSHKAYTSTSIPVECPCIGAVTTSANYSPLSLTSNAGLRKTSNRVSMPVYTNKPISVKVCPSTEAWAVSSNPYTRTVLTSIHPSVTPVTLNDFTDDPSVMPVPLNYYIDTKPFSTCLASLPLTSSLVALNDYTNTKTVFTKPHPRMKPVAPNYYIDKKLVPISLTSQVNPVSRNTYSDTMAEPTSICDHLAQVHDTNYPLKTPTLPNVVSGSTSVPINSNSYTTATNPSTDSIPNIAYLNPMSLVSNPEPKRISYTAYAPVPVSKLVPVSINFGAKTVPTNNYLSTAPRPVNEYSDTKIVPIIEKPSVTQAHTTNYPFATTISASAYPSVTTVPVNTYPNAKIFPTSTVPKVTPICDTDNSPRNLVSPSGYSSVIPVAVNTFSIKKTGPTSVDSNVTPVRGIDDHYVTPISGNVYPNIKSIPMNFYQNSQRITANMYPSVTPIPVNTYKNTVPASIDQSVNSVFAIESIETPIITPTSTNVYNSDTPFSANNYAKTKTIPTSVTPIRVKSCPFTSPTRASTYVSRNKIPLSATPTPASTFPCTNIALSSINPYTKYTLNNNPYSNPFFDSFYPSEIPALSSYVPQFAPYNTKPKVLPFETKSTPLNSMQASFPFSISFGSYVPSNAAIKSISSPTSDVSQLSSNTPCKFFPSQVKPGNFLTYKRPIQQQLYFSNPIKYQPSLTEALMSPSTTIAPHVKTSISDPVSTAYIKSLNTIQKPQAAFSVLNPFQSIAPFSIPTAANSDTPETHRSNMINPSITSMNKPCNVLKQINSNSAPNYTNIMYLTPFSCIQPASLSSNKAPFYFKMSPCKYLPCSSSKNIPIPINFNSDIMTSLNPYNSVKRISTNSDSSCSTKSNQSSKTFVPLSFEPITPCITPVNKFNSMYRSTSCSISSEYPCTVNTPYSIIPKLPLVSSTSSYLPKYTAHAAPSFNLFKTCNLLPASPISCAAIPISANVPVERPTTNSCRLNQNKPCDYIPKPTYIDSIPLISTHNIPPTSLPDTFNNVLSSPALATHLTAPYFNTFTLKPTTGLTPLSTNIITSSTPRYKTSSVPITSHMRPIYSCMPSVNQRQIVSANLLNNAAFAPVRTNRLLSKPSKYYDRLQISTPFDFPSQISSPNPPSLSYFNSPLKATPFSPHATYSYTPSSFDSLAPFDHKIPTPLLKTSTVPFSTLNFNSRSVSSSSCPLTLKLPTYRTIYTKPNVRPNESVSPNTKMYSNLSPSSQIAIPILNNIANSNPKAMPSPTPTLNSQASLPASDILTSVPNLSAYEYDKLPFAVNLPPFKHISPAPNSVNLTPCTKLSNHLPNKNVFPKVIPPSNIPVTVPQNVNEYFPKNYSHDCSKPNANSLHSNTPILSLTKTFPTPCTPPNSEVFIEAPQKISPKTSPPVPVTSAIIQEVPSTATPFSTSPLYYPKPLNIVKSVNPFENSQNSYIDQSNKYFCPSLNMGTDKISSYNGLPKQIPSTNSAPKNICQSLQNECPNCQFLSNLLKTNVNKFVTPEMFKNFNTQNTIVLEKNLDVVKYISDKGKEFRVKTSIPGIELKAWPSKVTVLKPKIVLEATEYNVVNFLPVVRHNKFDRDMVQDIAKDVVKKNYGNPIILKGVYNDPNSFAIVSDVPSVCGDKCLILWPTHCKYNM